MPSHFFTGQIDDVQVYSRALSYGEVASLAGDTAPFSEPFDLDVDGDVDFLDIATMNLEWDDKLFWP